MSTERLKPGSATLFDVRTFTDSRGALSVVEAGIDLPFSPQRLFYLYGSDPGQTRAGHAHRAERQCLIAMAGAAEIEVDNGRDRDTFVLDHPNQGLLLEPAVWVVVRFRDAAGVLAVLASSRYDTEDYIHDFKDFRSLVGGQ